MTDAEAQQRVAIVTGASGGIGRAVALGWRVTGSPSSCNYAGNAAPAEAAVAEIKAAGGEAVAVQADVADAADVERLFQETLGAFGGIDVVVNSAGIMPLWPIADGDVEAFDRVIATNLRGAFLVLARRRSTSLPRRPHHRVLEQRHRQVVPDLRPVHRLEGRRRRAGPACSPTSCAAATSRSTRSRPARWRPSCSSKGKTEAQIEQFTKLLAARTARPARGHRRGGLVPRRSRWRLGQRPGPARQRRLI